MRKVMVVLCLVSLSLFTLTTSTAIGEPQDAAATFTIELDDVREEHAQADLLNLFIRENKNQTLIILTLVNRRTSRGRATPKFYYLENLRVRPGDVLRIKPEGRARVYEARIESIEARFPIGKQPQLQIIANSQPLEPKKQSRPYPRLSTEGFQGKRILDKTKAEKGETKPDLITCTGDTPGDLRIRFKTLVDVVGVGLAFSTTYVIDDAQHSYDAANGLRTRYFGTRHVAKQPKIR